MRALVVDDDLLNREIARRMLGRLGVQVDEVPGGIPGLEAVDAAVASGHPFAMAFIDLSMPGMDGFETARLVRERSPATLLFALSGAEDGPEVRAAGFDGFIQKPITIEALASACADAGAESSPAFPAGSWTEAGSLFRYCPSCGSPRLASDRGRRWICPDCGFEYFHNVATAAGIVIESPDGIILIERAKEPERGKLCLPGGFVEPGERAEDAAARECREELGWAPERLEFLASYPNLYRYQGVPYATCDLYFRAQSPGPTLDALDPDPKEAAAVRVARAETMPWDRIAFESTRRALRRHLRLRASDRDGRPGSR